MKTKLFTLLLAIVASIGTTFAWDYERVLIGDLYYNLNASNRTAEVTLYYRVSGNIAIPTSVTYNAVPYSVTSIGGSAFHNCSGLTSVTIPNSVTSIGDRAFFGCSRLTSVTIPNSVTSIGDRAFYSCIGLTSVTIPNSVTSIGDYAFSYCTGLTSATIPNSVTNIGREAFEGCSGLTSVTIPNSVTSIGDRAFFGCDRLASITIPNSVTSIGGNAFYGCVISTINFLGNIEEWCNKPWASSQVSTSYELYINNELQKDITIPNSVTSIGNSAFRGCRGLTSVTIPNSVTSIGEYAFRNCRGLTSVTIPNSVTSIGESAFSGCVISTINFTGTIEEWCNKAWSPSQVSTSYELYINNELLKDITIPNSVTSIGNNAFRNCRGLTSVTIPNSVTSIGNNAFYNCSGLTSVTIPNSVTSIGESAFSGCVISTINFIGSIEEWCNKAWSPSQVSTSYELYIHNELLKDITIPNSVTSIGNKAFCGCIGLTSVTLGNSVTSIGDSAFYNCSRLTSVIIGTGVKVIETYAFSQCSAIKTITCYSMRPPTVKNNAFDGLPYSTIVYVPADYSETYTMHDAWGLYDVRPLGAQSTQTTNLNVTPAENTAEVAWPAVSGAATYELVIKDKNGNVICSLIFNAKGQLTSIAFHAPSRDGAPQHTQTAGFSFTVTGLDSGTSYDLTITAKNSNGQEIDKKNVTFHTNGLEPIENIRIEGDQPVKVYHEGQVYILRGEKVYTLTGQEVR